MFFCDRDDQENLDSQTQSIFTWEVTVTKHLEAKLCGTCTGAGGKEMPGEMFPAKAQRILLYLSVKLPPDTRRWARRSRRRSSLVGTQSEFGPESGHMCLCSYRETCCTNPPVSAEGKNTQEIWQMQEKQHRENKVKIWRKGALQSWFPMALESASHRTALPKPKLATLLTVS